MKTVLLTGATGFIGRHCVRLMLERGYTVHAISSRPLGNGEPAVHWHQADLLDPAPVKALIAEVRPTHLLHLAWYAVPGQYWTASENLQWVQSSLQLFLAFAQYNGRRAVLAGTCAEYDWSREYPVISEATTPLQPATLYGVCKHALHLILESFSELAGFSAAWGRIFFLYGPYEPRPRLVPSVVTSLLRREPALCSHGAQIRDFLHVHDVADAFVTVLESEVTGAINIASGTPVMLKDVIYALADRLGQRGLIRLGARPAPAHEPVRLVADVQRLREEVKWRPHYGLAEGLDQTIAWWIKHENCD